jgi:hypothetical protein
VVHLQTSSGVADGADCVVATVEANPSVAADGEEQQFLRCAGDGD